MNVVLTPPLLQPVHYVFGKVSFIPYHRKQFFQQTRTMVWMPLKKQTVTLSPSWTKEQVSSPHNVNDNLKSYNHINRLKYQLYNKIQTEDTGECNFGTDKFTVRHVFEKCATYAADENIMWSNTSSIWWQTLQRCWQPQVDCCFLLHRFSLMSGGV